MLSVRLQMFAVVLVSSVYSAASLAQESFAATPQEKALCSALIFDGKDQGYMGRAEPGIGWEHTHHWCDCVRFRFRAIKTMSRKSAFRHNLNEAIDGCDYVLGHASQGFHARPKVHVDKGRALKMLRDTAGAMREFSKAIELNPREGSAYSEMADLQRELGQQSEALKTVTLGLRHSPGARDLQKLYKELGGQEPFPEPIKEAAPDPLPSATEPPDSAPVSTEARQVADTTTESSETSDVQVGADPSGRSCRFCPPEEIQQRWNDFIRPDKTGSSP